MIVYTHSSILTGLTMPFKGPVRPYTGSLVHITSRIVFVSELTKELEYIAGVYEK